MTYKNYKNKMAPQLHSIYFLSHEEVDIFCKRTFINDYIGHAVLWKILCLGKMDITDLTYLEINGYKGLSALIISNYMKYERYDHMDFIWYSSQYEWSISFEYIIRCVLK